MKSAVMNPKFEKGQTVVLRPATDQTAAPRDSTIEPFIGQTGRVVDYYWVSPRAGMVFYIYKVLMGKGRAEIALHEDEIEAYRG
jgi:hypothetical protein